MARTNQTPQDLPVHKKPEDYSYHVRDGLFKMLDSENHGYIDNSKLLKMFDSLGYKLSGDELSSIIAHVDKMNKNINFERFSRIALFFCGREGLDEAYRFFETRGDLPQIDFPELFANVGNITKRNAHRVLTAVQAEVAQMAYRTVTIPIPISIKIPIAPIVVSEDSDSDVEIVNDS